MSEIPEFVDMTIPFVAGCEGSVCLWARCKKGVHDLAKEDIGSMYDGLPNNEMAAAVQGFIKVRIPLRSMFEKHTVEGEVISKLDERRE